MGRPHGQRREARATPAPGEPACVAMTNQPPSSPPNLDLQKWAHEQNTKAAERAHDKSEEFVLQVNEAAINGSNLALRMAMLINGGAAVALLTFVGGLSGEQKRAVAATLNWFAGGSCRRSRWARISVLHQLLHRGTGTLQETDLSTTLHRRWTNHQAMEEADTSIPYTRHPCWPRFLGAVCRWHAFRSGGTHQALITFTATAPRASVS